MERNDVRNSTDKKQELIRLGWIAVLGLFLGVIGFTPAKAKQPPSSAEAYVLGKLDGALGDELMDLLKPAKWQKQTDGLLIMAGKSVRRLNGEQRRNLQALHAAGHPVVLTHALPEHFHRLHAILGHPVPVTLREPYTYVDFYAQAQSAFGPKVFAMMPPPAMAWAGLASETRAQRRARAEELLDWVENEVLLNIGGSGAAGAEGKEVGFELGA